MAKTATTISITIPKEDYQKIKEICDTNYPVKVPVSRLIQKLIKNYLNSEESKK